jgi:hypothetical protein
MNSQPGDTHTVVVEKSSTSTIMLAIVLLVALVGGLILFNQYNASETNKNNAIEHAANQIGNAANKAGDAVEDAAKSAKGNLIT